MASSIDLGGSPTQQVQASVERVQISVTQAAHGFFVRDVVTRSGAAWIKAQADTEDNARVLGVVSEVTDANNFKVTQMGKLENQSGFVSGQIYYLSPGVSGSLTVTKPTTDGQFVRPVLLALSTTDALVLDQTALEIGVGDFLPATIPTTISPVGQIVSYGGTASPPTDWLYCNGNALSSTANGAEYAELYGVVGNEYSAVVTLKTRDSGTSGFPAVLEFTGGNRNLEPGDILDLSWFGSSYAQSAITDVSGNDITIGGGGGSGGNLPTQGSEITVSISSVDDKFFLPDLRGRTVVGGGLGDGLTERVVGDIDGEETHLLTVSELPAHAHDITVGAAGNQFTTNLGSKVQTRDAASLSAEEGGDNPHNNMQPHLVCNWIIRAKPISANIAQGPTGSTGPQGDPGFGSIYIGATIISFTRNGGVTAAS